MRPSPALVANAALAAPPKIHGSIYDTEKWKQQAQCRVEYIYQKLPDQLYLETRYLHQVDLLHQKVD